jgi:Xaa-Pro aminopeptidase
MKTELDAILKKKNVAGLIVFGAGDHNPAMMYLTGGGHFSNALLVKKTGQDALLIVNPMERDEAARTGMTTKTFNDFKFYEIYKSSGGNAALAEGMFYERILRELDLTSGKVLIFGQVEIGTKWEALLHVKSQLPDLQLVSETTDPVVGEAAVTKDQTELARIRRMGEITTSVVAQVAGYIQSGYLHDGVLYDETGRAVTIGDIKNFIDLWLAEQGAENPEGTIFSIGRDAGVPHSVGVPIDVLRAGQTIVFDIYPCEKGGGYFYDFTRTWCIGYAPEKVQKLYDQVKQVYETVTAEIHVGSTGKTWQKRVCDLYESMGHPTIQSKPDTTDGYNHSLGHGVGLHVHEAPWMSAADIGDNVFKPGMVFTIEPGLYYPEEGMGVRLEDTYYVDVDGNIRRFVEYPYDLVLPVKER